MLMLNRKNVTGPQLRLHISIHLMLMLNIMKAHVYFVRDDYFNTSYVNVKRSPVGCLREVDTEFQYILC